jgi:short-subunit dehydrogenase
MAVEDGLSSEDKAEGYIWPARPKSRVMSKSMRKRAPGMRGDSSGNGWAVVTGASSGIGLAFARELVRRGKRVLAVARRRDCLKALAREASEQGGSIVPLVADLQTGEGLGVVVERMVGLGTIDLLVNNAGIATFGNFQHSSLEQEIGAIRLNVHAVLTLTHAVVHNVTNLEKHCCDYKEIHNKL